MPKHAHQQDENCLFCKIARKEEKAYIVWENDDHMAFLSIFPNTPGVTVVIPKKHHPSYAFELNAQDLVALTLASKEVARILDTDLPDTMRTGLVYEGFGVNHVHAKLFPMHGPKLEEWKRIGSNIRTFFDEYPGYISSHDGERATTDSLKVTQYTLTRVFHKSLKLIPLASQEAMQIHSQQDALGTYTKQGTATFGIWQDARLVGSVSLHKIPNTNDLEMNYWLDENFTGRGIITAACKSILEYGFLTLRSDAIFIRCQEDNLKGSAVAQRLMFGNPINFNKSVKGVTTPFLEYCMHNAPWQSLRTDATYNEISALGIADPIPNKSFFTSSYDLFARNKLGFFATFGAIALSYAFVGKQEPRLI